VTQKALLDKTWAGSRVYDSPSMAADVRLESDNQPFIAVYVDDADFNPPGDVYPNSGSDNRISLTDAAGAVRLILEIAVGSPRTATGAAGEDLPDMGGVTRINATDPALELQMGLVTRQALQALLSTNVNNPWSEIWRHWVVTMTKIEVRRGGPGQEATPGVRYASRLVVIHADIIGEPVRGEDLAEYAGWRTFFEAAEADPYLAGSAALIRAHIEKPGGPLPGWRIEQKHLATTKAVMIGIGEGPVEGFDETVGIEFIPELELVNLDQKPMQGGDYQNALRRVLVIDADDTINP